jgi:Tfp pilus assembly protein PilF
MERARESPFACETPKCVTKHNYIDNSLLLQKADLLQNIAKFDESQGRSKAAYLQFRDSILGKTHPSTLTTMSNFALVLNSQGKYAEAESMNRQTLELKEEVLGKTHPETLTSVYCLAYLLQNK